MDEVLKDAQFNARDFFQEIDHPVIGSTTYPGLPFKLPETPTIPQGPAPLLGEHNYEVYCERLGYSRQDLVRLREMNII
jgi:crotonobetainyl-CoA:carnitine CoA-transferase CaiB-like acyl-CoA transferase